MKLTSIFFLTILTLSLNAQQKDSTEKNIKTIDSILASEHLNVKKENTCKFHFAMIMKNVPVHYKMRFGQKKIF